MEQSGWTVDTLKEHIDKVLLERDKALEKALEAAERRFELLNELRFGVATKDQVAALEKIVDDLRASRDKGEGKNTGYAQFIGWILFIISVVAFLVQNVKLK